MTWPTFLPDYMRFAVADRLSSSRTRALKNLLQRRANDVPPSPSRKLVE